MYHLINNFFQKNGKVFDLTTGDENYKIRISNHKTKILFFCKSYSFKGLIIKFMINILNLLKQNKKILLHKKIYNKNMILLKKILNIFINILIFCGFIKKKLIL